MTDPRYPTRRIVDPDIPLVHGKHGSERAFAEGVKQTLDVGLGRQGDGQDRFVRVRDLVGLGIASFTTNGADGSSGSSSAPGGPGGSGGFLGPPRPGTNLRPSVFTNVRTTGLWNGIRIYWDYPPLPPSGAALEYAGVEVYGAESINRSVPGFANATAIGTASGAVNYFTHDLGPTGFAKVWYYWLRWIYITSVQFPIGQSPFTPGTDAQGIRGSSDPSPAQLVASLIGQITGDSLSLGLGDRIALGSFTTANVSASINGRLLLVNTSLNGAIAELATLRQAGNILTGTYSMRIDLSGYVSGFGLVARFSPGGDLNPILPGDQQYESAFIIRANRFAIEVPNGPDSGGSPSTRFPFVVGQIINPDWLPPANAPDTIPTIANGGLTDAVGITGRLVLRGTLHADAISAGSIRARHIDAVSLSAEILRAERIITGSLSTAGDNNWRVVIAGGASLFPMWYGLGAVSDNTVYDAAGNIVSGPAFSLDRFGNAKLAGNLTVTGSGRFSTSGGQSSARVEVGGSDGLLMWAGSGARTRENAKFFFDTTGTLFVRGQPLNLPVGQHDGQSPSVQVNVVLPVGENAASVLVLCHAIVGAPTRNNNEKTFRSTLSYPGGSDQLFTSSREYTKGLTHLSILSLPAGLNTIAFRADVTANAGDAGQCQIHNARFFVIQTSNIQT